MNIKNIKLIAVHMALLYSCKEVNGAIIQIKAEPDNLSPLNATTIVPI